MRINTPLTFPPEKQQRVQEVRRLEYGTIFFLGTIIAVMYLTMGSSQAMKTAWIEDMLSLIPPLVILIAMRVREKKPNARFPYGYRRAPTVAFLSAATALSLMGLFLLFEAARSLLLQHHPSIGLMVIFGQEIWAGWVMMAALLYSAIPPVILGRMKLPLARELHEKALHTDAKMNKADWMTALAGVVGVGGVGLGFWWADSAAAAFIAVDVTRDGFTELRRAVADLMNERPTQVDQEEPHELIGRLRAHLAGLDGVQAAEVRLREDGPTFAGEAYLVFDRQDDLVARLQAASEAAIDFDWRLHDVVVTAIPSLDAIPRDEEAP